MKQLCYKCKHNHSGEIIEDNNGNEYTVFDCDLLPVLVIEDFNNECDDYEEE